MNDDLEQALRFLERSWYGGVVPPAQPPGNPDQQRRLAQLLADLDAVQKFALGISKGDLAQTLAAKGVTAGAFKGLQANLRHLTWQTQRIAQGDFEQRVDFMGEFSEAFNAMVRSLAEAREHLRREKEKVELQNAQLAQRGRELQKACELLERELRSVGEVQASLLPEAMPRIRGFSGAMHYRPALRAGGDYFDFFPLPENAWGFLVADVSGHGAPAAVVMAMTRVMVHLASRKTPPQEVLEHLNDTLCGSLRSDQFVTCCYGILDPVARSFEFASAGHPMPLLLENPGEPARFLSSEYGYPLGVAPLSRYTPATVSLSPGSVVLLYTDGITEAQGPTGEMFGDKRLQQVLQAAACAGAAEVRSAVLGALDTHRGPIEFADDVTLLVLRADP